MRDGALAGQDGAFFFGNRGLEGAHAERGGFESFRIAGQLECQG
jgi:hypothetical protein